jgi:hypothetical protein
MYVRQIVISRRKIYIIMPRVMYFFFSKLCLSRDKFEDEQTQRSIKCKEKPPYHKM